MCESTGVVVSPYKDYPQLLAVLLRMLGEGGDPSVKRDLLRLLGILGALDPHRHKVGPASFLHTVATCFSRSCRPSNALPWVLSRQILFSDFPCNFSDSEHTGRWQIQRT